MNRAIGRAAFFVGALALGGCGSSGGLVGPPGPSTQSLLPSDDTFINSADPDNNNGASASLYVGVEGRGGVTRALLRFAMPAALQGATVTSVQLKLTLRALGNGTAGSASTDRLEAVTETWAEGNGVGDAMMTFTVGQTCGNTVSGATWNQPDCAAGTTTPWTAPGGSVAATVSAKADTTNAAPDAPVLWDAAASGNRGMITDVQRWIDDPTSNRGWRISSSDETTIATAQRFYSAEADGTHGPALTIVYQPRS
jgi:hypothetical protein